MRPGCQTRTVETGHEWFERLPNDRGAEPLTTDDEFVLEVRLVENEGDRTHHLRTGPEGYTYISGPAAEPDAWLSIAGDVAEALRTGTVSVTAAVQSGRIRVGGDLTRLLANQSALVEVAARVAGSDRA